MMSHYIHFFNSRSSKFASLFEQLSPLLSLRVIATLIIISICISATYNVFFHKLASFPGPFLARTSVIWRIFHSQQGRIHRAILDQHRKYGPVVRISPNELSFASVESFKAIYGHRSSNVPLPIKGEFYAMFGAGFDSSCIGSERDPQKASKMRKMLSVGFSVKSLSEQEDIIISSIDGFIDRIGQDGVSSKGLNLTKWYEMISFDVLGEMAFGQSFHNIQTGKLHAWTEIIFRHLYFITLFDDLRRLPFIVSLTKLMFPSTLAIRNYNSQFVRDKVAQRLETKETRKDFLTPIIKNYEEGNIRKEEVAAHSSTLLMAGGETTSTFLAAVTFYLLKNPQYYQKLQAEILDKFSSYEEINAVKARELPYLQAVISEGLRIHPPLAFGLPRISPGMHVGKHFIPEGAEISTHIWSITHSEQYFNNPYQFKPERWLDPTSTDNKEASQPFLLGPRACPGQNFATMEIILILTKMIWMYNLELLDSNLDWEGQSEQYVLWRKPALMVRFSRR